VLIALAPGLSWLDPVAAALIGLLVAAGAIRLLAAVLRAMRRGEGVEVDPD
jgi:Co/Zn/Cd efflux system component